MTVKDAVEGPLDVIVWQPAAELMAQRFATRFTTFVTDCEAGGALASYPDGSLWIQSGEWVAVLDRLLVDTGLQGEELDANTTFRALAPFPTCRFELVTTGSYHRNFGERRFIVRPTPNIPSTQKEWQLARLPVTVEFVRKPKKEVVREFEAALSDWQQHVWFAGCFGEGPALVHPGIQLEGRECHFYIDISRSGQSTLNWLTLNLMNFGRQVYPVESITYAKTTVEVDPDWIAEMVRRFSGWPQEN